MTPKRCPYCRRSGETRQDGMRWFYVECPSGCVRTLPRLEVEQAIEAWNRMKRREEP